MLKSLFVAVSLLSVGTPNGTSLESNANVNSIYVEKASFCGADVNTFSEWVSDRVVYPETSRKFGCEGLVEVMFSVDAQGRVKNIKVAKSSQYQELNAEVIRVVSMSPRWRPMKVNGEGIETNYIMGINFQLVRKR